ncbi:excinuclease ABC subunit UvrC [Thermanaerovibrio acidaminovorans]|jgi:excinuclease ABC subunit C|uniref:excinuclease ABC subunit UvrC n=1 Tax=Thermanaerovibrio acidaminovorans TaxID=81462 RepID=UPI002492D1DA|nr:excinuclease ABC subunit UvrC [Thermanaerovibrio acidaminovorans]
MADEALMKHVRSLPERPGVYIMRDRDGNVIYVGKAKALRRRVMSYFRHGNFASPRLRKLVETVHDISVMRTATEAEALILEARLIRQLKPFFNVELKMSERYPYIRVTQERFPRVMVTRVRKGEGLFIGPYVKVRELRELLRLLDRFFPLRKCSFPIEPPYDRRPCIYHAIGKCLAPCAGLCDEGTYRRMVAEAVMLLQGRGADLVERLKRRMEDAAYNRLAFEEAAHIRDMIRAIWRVGRQAPMAQVGDEDPLPMLWALQERLKLPQLPWRIEGYDISHHLGSDTVGSRVVFEQGRPNKALYRRYNIEGTLGDDFRALEQVMRRRFTGSGSGDLMPNLILIDGGRVQLEFALRALDDMGVNVPVASLAKEEEEIYLPGRVDPLRLDRSDGALRMLQMVRDEAHRFAVSSHRDRRGRRMRRTRLEDIPGVGKARASQLLSRFGSVRNVASASLDELASMRGIGERLAKRISDHLKEEDI